MLVPFTIMFKYEAVILLMAIAHVSMAIDDTEEESSDESSGPIIAETDNMDYNIYEESNETRIYNGDVAQPSDPHYTFMVAIIVYDEQTGNRLQCGGSLINERWVLTAGHCVDEQFRQAIRDDRVTCWVGAYNLAVDENSDFRDRVGVSTLVEHIPPWKGGKRPGEPEDQRNDIALLRLASPVNTRNFRPICIGNAYYEGGGVRLAGWGKFDGVRNPDYLNRADGKIVDLDDCQGIYGRVLVQGTMICARLYNKNGGNAEQAPGDSGGPLFFTPRADRYIQVGIVSFNKNLPNQPGEPVLPDTRYPGVYTRTYSYIHFMRNTIRSYDPNLSIETLPQLCQ